MKLNYTEQGAGPVIILMHGMFGSLSNLGNLGRELSANYRVIAVDLRNHGDSPHESIMDIATMAADIVELMDDLTIANAALVGHSLGGKIGMQVALNYPDRVKSLVVADIAPVDYPQSNDNVVEGLQALAQQSLASRNDGDKILSAFVDDKATRAFILKNLHRNRSSELRLKINVDAIVANYSGNLTAAPKGDAFMGPTLFVKGEKSAYIQEKHKPIIKHLFPNSELVVMDGVGHWLHAEKPGPFNDSVIGFLVANG
jgi:esterase